MKRTKTLISLLLSILMLLSSLTPALAATAEEWKTYWENAAVSQNGLTLQPGADETERYVSWYITEGPGECSVLLSVSGDLSGAEEIKGASVDTYQGDKCAKVHLTGLEAGTKYYYAPVSDGVQGETYSFTTLEGNDFTALFVSDVHIAAEAIEKETRDFDELVNKANDNCPLDMIISAGDQTVIGTREELQGICSPPITRNLTFAFSVGNHDRKSVDYRFFKAVPNEFDGKINHYQGSDYWFVKGSVLFLFINSNSPSAGDHKKFVKEACEANPDAKWRVVVMHHDLYADTIEHRRSENKALRLIYSSIFDAYDIDIALLGHSHHFSVSDIIYGGKKVRTVEEGETILNTRGTAYIVASSVSRPRVEEGGLQYSDLISMGMDDPLTPLYNILDFSENKITFTAYRLDTDEVYSSFSLEKDENYEPQKLGFWRRIGSACVSGIGTVYAFFEIFGHYRYLREKGYDVSVFKTGF